MRRALAALGMLMMVAGPAFAARRLSADELGEMVAAAQAQHRSDAALAQDLYAVELSARVDDAVVERLMAGLGPEAKRALRAVADEAVFLDPQPGAMAGRPAPDVTAQRAMLAQTIHYVARTLHGLPNFLATRETDSYDDAAHTEQVGAWPARNGFRYRQSYEAPIAYRDGRELDDAAKAIEAKRAGAKRVRVVEKPAGLTSWGEFGPVLEIVLLDAAKGRLGWSHWEERDGKPVAVFQFSIPQSVSHYNVGYEERQQAGSVGASFGTVPGGANNMRQHDQSLSQVRVVAAYHGTLTIDPGPGPEMGAVLRVVIEADMPATAALQKAAMMVEYGPMRIGEDERICPVRSVTVSEVRDLYQPSPTAATENVVDHQLNDVRFSGYRRFGSEATLVMKADAGAGQEPKAGVGEPGGQAADSAGEAATAASGSAAVSEPAVAGAAAGGPVVAPAAAATASAVSDEEVIVRDVAEMPGMSGAEEAAKTTNSAADRGFTLQVETRLVDMGVVAVDKHGKPVTDLKPEEIAVYDNGRKQKVAAFHHADAAAGVETAGRQPAVEEGTYTNGAAGAGADADMPDLMVVLIDESHLPFNDLNRARSEVEKYLEGARVGSRLALYALGEHGFRALVEVTTDRAAVEARLKSWMPDAAGTALAQEQDVRNRQQFDYVRRASDLQYVNGNHEDSADAGGDVGADPQLRKMGDDPLGRALLSLTALARHFAPVAGHKTLVWISGDSALVDWRDQTVRVERAVEDQTAAIHHTMDALNEAHMALYAVDASIESVGAAGVDPSLANPDVELAPTATETSAPGYGRSRATTAGRTTAALQQDSRGIQGPVRELAEATGGRAFNKGSDLTATLKTIAQEETALYEIGFHPDTTADGKFHTLRLEVVDRKDVRLRYRTGYLYNAEAGTAKERLQRAVWSPQDLGGLTLRAEAVHGDPTVNGDSRVRLRIGFAGLALEEKDGRWTDDLYIFLAQRDDAQQKARVTGDTLRLSLKQATYETGMPAGIPYQHEVVVKGGARDSVRVIVVDGNSGRMGSVTIPAGAFVE
jgi:VWFA-related protein